jgi:DNA-nicking Smr family endonuclease
VPDAAAHGPFTLERRAAGAVDGWASGFDRRRLPDLRSGRIAPDVEIDLHGMTRAAARAELVAALHDAIAAGQRCVLVVHGRGMRSDAGPVLRDALPAWLAEPPHGASVLAFAAGEPQRGGATYVLLRRDRARR